MFLNPVKDRRNLFVSLNSEVTELKLTSDECKEVKVRTCCQEVLIPFEKEVILAAGPVNTPKILMLSGIGPKDHLRSKNIDVVKDLPVGKNLQIQYSVPIFVQLDVENKIVNDCGVKRREVDVNKIVGILGLDEFESPPDLAIYHHFFKKQDYKFTIFIQDYLQYNPAVVRSLTRIYDRAVLVFSVTLVKPKSRGIVELRGSNHLKDPIIKSNYFTDKERKDFESLHFGFKYVLKLLDSSAFNGTNATFIEVDIPICRNFKFPSYAYVKCYIKNMGYFQSNLAGTTRMSSVVDEKLNVIGVKNLKIVDSGTFPDAIWGNSMGTVAAFADIASKLIKGKWT